MDGVGMGGRRPEVHLTAPDGWLNDPLAVTYRDGLYHAFYQCVPGSDGWQPWCSWGHSTSPDLVRWTAQPTALMPGDGDLGCWSGGICVPPNGSAVIFYTSVTEPDLNLGAVRTATPVDESWTAWRKGPVVVRPPDQEGLLVFRDPTIVRDGTLWRMLVGAGYRDGTAAVLTYTSADLQDWRYQGPLATRSTRETDPVWTGSAWECPQLLAIGDRHVLIVSVWDDSTTNYVVAAIGRYADGRLAVERWTQLTYGPGHYAATAFTDRDGLPALLFWIREVRGDGWIGALSVPYRIALDGTQIRLAVHPAVRDGSAAGRWVSLDWRPGTSSGLALRDPGGQLAANLIVRGSSVDVHSGGRSVTAPLADGPVEVVADAGVLEVCTGSALVGLPISPS
jgi:beta-fructofuranosidase